MRASKLVIICLVVLATMAGIVVLMTSERENPQGRAALNSLPADPVARLNELIDQATPGGSAARWAMIEDLLRLHDDWMSMELSRPEAMESGFSAIDAIQGVSNSTWPPNDALDALTRLRDTGYFDLLASVADGPIPVAHREAMTLYRPVSQTTGTFIRMSLLALAEMRVAANDGREEDLTRLFESLMMIGQGQVLPDGLGEFIQRDCLREIRRLMVELELSERTLARLDEIIELRTVEVDWAAVIQGHRLFTLATLSGDRVWVTEQAAEHDQSARDAMALLEAGDLGSHAYWGGWVTAIQQLESDAEVTRVLIAIERHERTKGRLPESLDAIGVASTFEYAIDGNSMCGYSLERDGRSLIDHRGSRDD